MNNLIDRLKSVKREISIMEVCGTHSRTAQNSGLRSILPENIRLVSGPGCPVCVTGAGVIDELIKCAENGVVAAFGDVLAVCGSNETLSDARSRGADVRVIYSPFDVIEMSQKELDRQFTIAAVGFETTVPVYAALPSIIEKICADSHSPDGFIAPGHVAAVTGVWPFRALCERFCKPFVVTGFTPEAMIAAIYEIARQAENGVCETKKFYGGVVSEDGQTRALGLIDKYFEPCDAYWRGIGVVENSGLRLREKYILYGNNVDNECGVFDGGNCRCGEVMLGKITPKECDFFGTACTPKSPVGACMATSEGACGIWFSGGAL